MVRYRFGRAPVLFLTAISFVIFLGGCAPFHWAGDEPQTLSETAPPTPSAPVREFRVRTQPGQPSLTWPVPRRYAMRDGFHASRAHKQRKHLGIDFPAPKSTPIFAAHDGWITYTGHKFHGYGRMVIIDNGHGWQTLYAHMNSIKARQGSAVHQGDIIGEVGATGHAHGSHLHFELMRDSMPMDPSTYLTRQNIDGSQANRKIANQL